MYKFSNDFKKELLYQKIVKNNAEIHIIKRGPELSVGFDGILDELSFMLSMSLEKLCEKITAECGAEKAMDTLDKMYEFARNEMMLKGDADESK